MTRWNRLALVMLFGSGVAGLTAASKDTDPNAAPDWSGYTGVGSVVGEVMKAGPKGMTLRVTWYIPEVTKNKNNKNKNNKGIKGRNQKNKGGNRGGLGKNQNFRNPFAPNRNPGLKVTVKEESADYDLSFEKQTLIRYKALPPRFDSNGEKMSYTREEQDALRKPVGVPGYAASMGDLVPGTIVEVELVREKSSDDLIVKHAVLLGMNPNPPRKDDRKKKK